MTFKGNVQKAKSNKGDTASHEPLKIKSCLFFNQDGSLDQEKYQQGCLGGSVVERQPLARVKILGSWDRVPYRAPSQELASPSAYVSASVYLS